MSFIEVPWERVRERFGLLRGIAAVNGQILAREKARLIAGQEDDGLGDLFRGGRTLGRHHRKEAGFGVFVASGEAVEHGGGHRPRGDPVYAKTTSGPLPGCALGHTLHRVVAWRGDRSTGPPEPSRDGRPSPE